MRPWADARVATIGAAVTCVALAVPRESPAADQFSGLLGATTDYVFRGVSQTRGNPAIQGGLNYRGVAGWFVGAWASTIDPNPGPGATVEWNAYAGYGRPFRNAWHARLSVVHYAYPGDSDYAEYDYDELAASITYLDRLSAGIAWSPNTTRYSHQGLARDQTAVSYDLVARWPLRGPLHVTGSVGYYDLDDLFGTGYGYWSVGLAGTFEHLLVELTHCATSDTAVDLFGGDTAGSRWALTATWRFQH